MVADSESLFAAKQEIDSAFLRGMAMLEVFAARRATMALPPAAAGKMLIEYRARYRRGLVKFLNNDPAGTKEMYAAVTGIELAQGVADQRGFWWVVLAFFEALIHKALPEEVDARPVCNGVELRMRRLAEGSPQPADPQNGEPLLREMLYSIARSKPVSDRLRTVKEAFRATENPSGETGLAGRVEPKAADPDSAVFRPESAEAGRVAVATTLATESGAENMAAFVEIAGQQVSRSLFDLFSDEARRHVATLKTELEVLKGHGVVTDAMLLAVHSLSGVSGTVHFDNLRDLSSIFARALAPLSMAPLSGDEEDLIEQAIETTERMVVEALGLAEPTPVPELLERLESVAAGAPVRGGPMIRDSDEVMLPEEEGAIEREESGKSAAAPLVQPAPNAFSGAVQADDQPAGGRQIRRMSDEVDSDLVPAFLDEANQRVPSLADALDAWRVQPALKANALILTGILQNLKGSARMAGVMSVGELCQHMETRVEAAQEYASAPPSIIEELANSMNRLAVLFDKLQPQGGAALEAARRFAPPATEHNAQPETAPARHTLESPPRMLRIRADLIDLMVGHADQAAAARQRVEKEVQALRATVFELAHAGARLQEQVRAFEGHSVSLSRNMAEAVDDVETVREELLVSLANADATLAERAGRDRDLRRNLTRLRMLPFASVAERLHRVVRQSAKALGKRANLDITGAQVELERSAIERLVGPLEELLRNAIAHGIEDAGTRAAAGKAPIGEIRLDVSEGADGALILLTDDGAGLDMDSIRARAQSLDLIAGQSSLGDEEIVEFIFLPGFSSARKGREPSAGDAGLAGVRASLATLGGSIEMSQQRGKGTSFRLRLPPALMPAAEQDAPPLPPQDERPGAGPVPIVLVVEDSLSVRRMAERLFKGEGYRVVTARDGVEALERLLEEVPDLMVVDADMPRMNGIELIRKVRANARLAEVPVIMISSDTTDERQKVARDIGVDHFLGKPCQEDELLHHVAGFIAAVRSSN